VTGIREQARSRHGTDTWSEPPALGFVGQFTRLLVRCGQRTPVQPLKPWRGGNLRYRPHQLARRAISIYSGIPIVTLYENVKPNDAANGSVGLASGIASRWSAGTAI
jgi:hypothetical protein